MEWKYASRLEILSRRSYYDFIDIHIGRLFDGIGNRAGDGICRNGQSPVKLVHRLRRCLVGSTCLQLRVDRTWRDDGGPNPVSMHFRAQAFTQRTDSGLGGAINSTARRKHFDAKDGSSIDNVAALLLLHMGQSGRNSVEHTLDIEVDHAVPLVDLQKRKRRDWHNTGIVDQDIDLSVCVDGLLHQSLDLRPICYVDRHGKRLCAIGLNILNNCIETPLTPSFARWRAVLSPSPLLAPVMTTTFPSIFLLMAFSLLGRGTVASRFPRLFTETKSAF